MSDFEANIYVVDGKTSRITATIPVSGAHTVAVNPVTNRIYVAQEVFPGAVAVVDGKTNHMIASVPTGGDLTYGVGVDAAHSLVYSTDQFGSVGIINAATNTLKSTVQTGGEPSGIAVDPFTETAYVDNTVSDNTGSNSEVQIISGKTDQITNTVPAGPNPLLNTLDIYRGLLYVGDLGNSAPDGSPENQGVTVIKTH